MNDPSLLALDHGCATRVYYRFWLLVYIIKKVGRCVKTLRVLLALRLRVFWIVV